MSVADGMAVEDSYLPRLLDSKLQDTLLYSPTVVIAGALGH